MKIEKIKNREFSYLIISDDGKEILAGANNQFKSLKSAERALYFMTKEVKTNDVNHK